MQKSYLESMGREELLATVRKLLVEADALSSRIAAVNEIGVAMNRTLDLDTIQQVIADQAKWLLDCAHCSVCLQGADDWEIRTLFGEEEPGIVDLKTMENLAHTLRTGQPQLILKGSPSPFLKDFQSQLIIPLVADNVLLGTINFGQEEAEKYTYDDMRIVYILSLQLASAIRNANIVAELRRTQAELQLRIEELDAYSHTIAHDLKSPLTNIVGRTGLLKLMYAGKLPPEAIDIIDSVEKSSMLMTRMINQLLWLAKLRNDEENRTLVNVKEVIDLAVARFQHLIEQNKITIVIADEMPNVVSHDQWLEEIFANLISNAIKYMGEANPNPSIEISGTVEDNQVRYTVKDTGVGIKEEDKKRLFQIFSRLHTVNAEGLGLGLSIVNRIISKANGEIGVDSVFGEGSTFWFKLPNLTPPSPVETQPKNTPAESPPPTVTKDS